MEERMNKPATKTQMRKARESEGDRKSLLEQGFAYVHVNFGPNRHARRAAAVIARKQK